MAEIRQLSLHPLAIHTFIKAQAGSLGKALSEAVMNSIDAFASNVDITLNANGFEISDDGKGFQSREEIEAWFETLGFPHDDGNHRVYGKFGMGRAQMWAFARTTWESTRFVMHVDVKAKGLDYTLDEVSPGIKGTVIKGEFYEPMPFARLTAVEMELENLVKYVPGLITLNGRPISKDPSTEKWDLETKEAWMRFDKSMHSLDVYNGGVLVAHFPRYRFRCTGVVITKPSYTLSLNVARNDILEAECPVWPNVAKHFPKEEKAAATPARERAPRRKLEEVAREIKAGIRDLEEAVKDYPELFISVHGRTIALRDLQGRYGLSRPVVITPKGDDFGKRLSKLKRALVVSKETLELFGLSTAAELKALVRGPLAAEAATARNGWATNRLNAFDQSIWSDTPETLFADLKSGKNVLATAELDDASKAVQIAWRRNLQLLRYAMSRQKLPSERLQQVALGDCPSRLGWLGAGNELVLRQKEAVAAMNKPFSEFMRYCTEVLHEVFTQDMEMSEAQGRSELLKLMTADDSFSRFVISTCASHVRQLRESNLPLPRTRLADFEEILAE